ncbi:hypothetical protein MASR2M44_04100 [Bacteroidota bacterium]
MKSLFNPETLLEITERINQLRPDSKALWGVMNPAQMLKHCQGPLEIATGRKNPPRMFIGRLLAPFMKAIYYNDKPWGKGIQTAPEFKTLGNYDFNEEKAKLLELVNEFSKGGEAKCSKNPNPFFGKLTPEQTAFAQYKHLDHHLPQFGI